MRQISEIKIVVASPSDVNQERIIVLDAIQELNHAYETKGIFVRGVGWEDAVPSIGEHPQALINKQILDQHDILIAIFWTKLGTPTAKARSGTIEEIDQARMNLSSPFGDYRLQIYFKEGIEKFSDLDSPEQLIEVLQYRKTLHAAGILYRTFSKADELERLIRINIQKAIDISFKGNIGTITADNTSSESHPTIIESSEEEPELFDVTEAAELSIQKATQAIFNLNFLMEEINAEATKQTSQSGMITNANITFVEKKKFINQFADFLKVKSADMKREAEIGQVNFKNYIDSMITFFGLGRVEFSAQDYSNRTTEILNGLEGLLQSIRTTREQLSGFREIVSSLPKFTIQFKQAKRQLVDAANDCLILIDELEKGIYELTSKT